MPELVYNPRMDGLPAIRQSEDQLRALLIKWIAAGKHPPALARRLAPSDPKKRASYRARIRTLLINDMALQEALVKEAQMEGMVGLPLAMRALARRSRNGNVLAIKLLAEITGFHNPKLTHDHTGRVEIAFVNLPRPEVAMDGTADEIEDADVVE